MWAVHLEMEERSKDAGWNQEDVDVFSENVFFLAFDDYFFNDFEVLLFDFCERFEI